MPGLGDGVDAELGPRAMRRATFDRHLEPDETLVSEGEIEMAGLRHDGSLGLEAARHLLGAEARIFLVCHAGDQDVARELVSRSLRGRDHHGGDPTLHVEGTAPIELSGFDPRPQGIAIIACERDRIDMAVEHQRSATAPSLGDPDHGRATFALLEAVHLETTRP
jgi:hypothetical protein